MRLRSGERGGVCGRVDALSLLAFLASVAAAGGAGAFCPAWPACLHLGSGPSSPRHLAPTLAVTAGPGRSHNGPRPDSVSTQSGHAWSPILTTGGPCVARESGTSELPAFQAAAIPGSPPYAGGWWSQCNFLLKPLEGQCNPGLRSCLYLYKNTKYTETAGM